MLARTVSSSGSSIGVHRRSATEELECPAHPTDAEVVERHVHGRQRRLDEPARPDVVVADDGDGTGNVHGAFAEAAHEADRGLVVRRDDCRRRQPGGDELGGGALTALPAEPAVEDQRVGEGETVPLHRLSHGAQAIGGRGDSRRTGEEPDRAV